ncbi:hypothetical protein GOODEAATRI_009880 [Goodea atripinnis]|uniref:Uncharacterized protein n=1 Tax=Goodea atripinnis TaxID=208336 RepID=A0ABV0MQT9_9TELE
MCNKGGVGWPRTSRGLTGTLPRTRTWLLGLIFAAMGWMPLPGRAEVEIDMLGGMVLLDAGGEGEELGGGGSELEASMHSSLLHDFQEVTESLRVMDAGDMPGARQETATPTAFPDSSAVVGRIFQIKVPNKMEDVYLGDIVKGETICLTDVSGNNRSVQTCLQETPNCGRSKEYFIFNYGTFSTVAYFL